MARLRAAVTYIDLSLYLMPRQLMALPVLCRLADLVSLLPRKPCTLRWSRVTRTLNSYQSINQSINFTTAQGAMCMAEWLKETKFYSIPIEPGSTASGP